MSHHKKPIPPSVVAQAKIHAFADYLRQRQRAKGLVTEAQIAALSDDDILECYRKCSECGEYFYSKADELRTILESDTPERAFELQTKINHERHGGTNP